jgi:hypothetical protein
MLKNTFMRIIWACCLILLSLFWCGEAKAGELSERLADFKHWEKLTTVKPAVGDLVYPEWMQGNWEVKSTLSDLAAPLAPAIVTPGFESNRQYLSQPISFKVRFVESKVPATALKSIPVISSKSVAVVADRAFNGLNLARAYLNDAVLSVKVDPKNPNRQITFLRGERQLVSVVSGRATETISDRKFIGTEVFQQIFKGGGRPYFNIVESTTAYHKLDRTDPVSPVIEADQVTAVYLSPQDPNYFKAGSRPIALYRYRLEFFNSDQ